MDPLSVAGSIAGLVTLADAVFRGVYKYCKAAADAHTEIKELADRLRSLAGILHSLGILADALEQDGSYPTLQITLISDATKLLGEIQDHLNKPQMKMDGSRFGKIHQSLKWPFTKFKTKDFTEKLSQQQDIISLALDADTLKSLVELLSSSKDIQKQMESVQVGITNLQMLTRVEVDAERQRVLDFFLKVNPQSYLDTSLKLRHPGTGLWLTESVAFQQWIETTGSKIWLSGIPGAGKTVLTGAMVQKALEKGKGSPKIGVAFFFCDYKDPSTTVLSNILGAMASELARQSDQAFEKLKELFEILHPRDGLSRDAGSDIMHDHLENMFNCFDQVIMIIDGLDECSDNTDDIVQTLANIAEYSANVSMALVSRDEYNIAFNLRQSFTKIPVGARKEDILLYVGSEIDKRTRNNTLRITNVELKDEILTRLSNEADGMFRWVTCQLDYLCGCPTDADRREALKELPPTLDKTYERILRRINQSHPRVQKIVQRCLQLIGIASQFPIHINHLRWLVSIPETPNAICEENDIITEAEIAFQCSSLIRKSQDEYEFEFSHFTVREYLGRETLLDTLDFASYYVSDHIGYSALTQQYLKFLQLGNFHYKCHLDRDEQVKTAVERSTNFPLYPEAVARWLFTLRYGPLDPSTLKLAKSLFHPQKNPSFISWAAELIAQSMSHDPRALADPKSLQRATSLVTEPTFRTIHVAALLDLPEICEYLIQADHQWNSISPIGTPLECSISRIFGFMNQTWLPDPETACSMDYISYATHHPGKVTELLRTAGSIIQSPPDVYAGKYLMTCATLSAIVSLDFSPISSLVSTGWVVSDEEATIFDQAVELLLLKYPDEYLDSPCRQLEQLSASLRDLIESLNKFRIFDSNAGYNMCETAWTAAIKLGCNFTEEITLMDTRITLSLEALIRKCEFAIDNEDADLTQICLEDPRITGPEIDDDGTEKCGYSLLRRAIRMGSAKTVKMFHSVGYIMDKVSPDGSRPIHKAWNCREDIIELILGSGASHLDPDVDGNSVWHLAALNFEAETVSALIKLTGEGKISALRMQNNRGYTPLTLAIQALLDSHKEEEDDDEDDEDEDDDDDDETESIMSIIRETMETTVKLISDACEGDELCWQCTGSPWDLAAQSGSEVVVECLHNSSVHLAPIQEGCPTPLHALTHFASQACAEILINLYPMAKNMKYEGLIPLECMVRCCLRAGKIPQPGVIETLRCDSICATIPESNSALWESICSFCSKNLSSEFLILSNDQVLSLESIFLALASKEIFDAYEQLKNQCAAIPLFSALTALRYASPAFTHIFNEIISCTKLWTSNYYFAVKKR
ncbi:hypothetical protein F4777DRAFT_38863 [Nemania sp. FL0916]|nr:hypothetical protein F4777DRAFT_38863 [Nemania sp. FL0916]